MTTYDAYRKGLCIVCRTTPHAPRSVRCEKCNTNSTGRPAAQKGIS